MEADTVWYRCGPLHKRPRKHVLSARERDTEKGLGNFSVCPVWAQAFQNAQFSTSIYRGKPAAEHTPWLLIHVEMLRVIKKRVWRLQANSFYLLQKLCLKILWYMAFPLNTSKHTASSSIYEVSVCWDLNSQEEKCQQNCLWQQDVMQNSFGYQFPWKVSNVKAYLFGREEFSSAANRVAKQPRWSEHD